MNARAALRYPQARGRSMQATTMTSGYRKFSELSMPPVKWTTSVTIARSARTCSMACKRCSFQTETRNMKNSERANHSTIPARKGRMGSGLGVRRRTASSMASKTIRIRMRTFTSQVSQFRSSEMECMNSVVGRSLFVVDALVVVIRRFAADPGVGC